MVANSNEYKFELHRFCKSLFFLFTISFFFSCKAQSGKDTLKLADSNPKAKLESFRFTAHKTELHTDGSREEIDTITGYQKYYYKNGKLQMEGKVTKASPKDYRDSIWKYYNEREQLMNQETYTKEGKINQKEFMYFKNGNPLSETYQYYEGDYKDKTTFRFHKIEKIFYTNGQIFSERHTMNGTIIETKCWDAKGNPKPLEYMNTVKTMQVD